MNKVQVAYLGSKPSVMMEWQRRRYTFVHSKPVWVPDDFGQVILRKQSFVLADDMMRPMSKQYEPCEIVVRRWGAMGDLLMFRAAVAGFARLNPGWTFWLRCQERFAGLFAADGLWKGIWSIGHPAPAGVGGLPTMMFEHIAERDHTYDHKHRVGLFMDAIAGHQYELKREDWLIPVDRAVIDYVERWVRTNGLASEGRERPVVAVQIRGSGKMKTLPTNVMRRLIKEVTADYDVVVVEEDLRFASEFAMDGVFSMPNRDALHAIELMKHCDAAITMDSGAMWMAHCAAIPLLAILGPNRPEQRISMHTAAADAVCLNEIIDCPVCFEQATACNKRYDCMRNQPDWGVAIGQIMDKLHRLIEGEVALPQLEPESV